MDKHKQSLLAQNNKLLASYANKLCKFLLHLCNTNELQPSKPITMNQKILVIGATGMIGQAVAKQLNQDGFDVIVLSRDREKAQKLFSKEYEIVQADVLQPETLSHVFQGIDGVYVSLPEKDAPAAIPNIIQNAREAGVKQIAYTSGCTVREENAWHPMIKGHHIAETMLRESGIPHTLLKLTMVMDMIPRFANQGKPFIIGKQNHGWSWIYTGDLAKMASGAFKKEEAKNRAFTVFGPDTCTITDAVDQYNELFFPDAKPAKPQPIWLARLIALFVGSQMRYAVKIFKYFETHSEEGDPSDTYKILGKPETGLKAFFAKQNKQ
jgi:uncharacterized protein YbjT (DUF2867 family)